jgi:hypothetical protein
VKHRFASADYTAGWIDGIADAAEAISDPAEAEEVRMYVDWLRAEWGTTPADTAIPPSFLDWKHNLKQKGARR